MKFEYITKVPYWLQGRIQDIQIEGGTKDYVHAAYIPSEKRAVP